MNQKREMDPIKDLLYALFSMAEGFLTLEQLLTLKPLWSHDRSLPLRDILPKLLSPERLGELDILVHAQRSTPPASEVHIEEDLGDSILLLPLDEDFSQTTLDPGDPAAPAADLPDPGPTRYRPIKEIGRGGLGRVLAAIDVVLGREVAIKEMITGSENATLLHRFLREGEIAGKLLHPNIVPIFDVGVRWESDQRIPYFAMGKIPGHDLKDIIEAVERGSWESVECEVSSVEKGPDSDLKDSARKATSDPRLRFSRTQLLRIFQDVCLAMAYAHDHGVLHRDLKPANIMVGNYGEVYVVDWGLAKIIGQDDEPEGDLPQEIDTPSQLTLDGQIMGTAAYMPPEQAAGQVAEIDERSDIYSLGAILYEILTSRPPFGGESVLIVLSKVVNQEVMPPSQRVSQPFREALSGSNERPEISPEMDDIVLKAMAKEKDERYASARDLYDDIQLFLDGEKERERHQRQAREKVAEGKALVVALAEIRRNLGEQSTEAKKRLAELKPLWPLKRKREVWAIQQKVKDLEDELVETFTRASAAFLGALQFERKNKDARAALARMYWEQFLREEKAGSRPEMIHYESLVREYNDGEYDLKLRGDGTLTLSTRVYPCSCLSEGRLVSPQELAGSVECGVSGVEKQGEDAEHSTLDTEHSNQAGQMDFHPISGRALNGWAGAEGLPRLEPEKPVRLRVHAAACKTQPLEGADAWLFRYEEKDRILIPVFPEGVSMSVSVGVECGVSSVEKGEVSGYGPGVSGGTEHSTLNTLHSTLDTLFDTKSPYRPQKGLHLGRTPLDEFTLPMGSYLLILAKEGFRPVRCTLSVGRLAHEELDVTLYQEVPRGFVQVSQGGFFYQGDKGNPYSSPRENRETEDFLMAKFPVTCRDYLAFVNDLAQSRPEEAASRVPRESEKSGFYWPKGEDGLYVIPTTAEIARLPMEMKKAARRLAQSQQDWMEDWPVFGVSWEDMASYAAWQTKNSGRLFSLPHELQWEKSARGADGRCFPWGNDYDAAFCNMNQSFEEGMHPCEVDSFSWDESPYGVRGLGGNSRDACVNDVGASYPNWRMFRGGAWRNAGIDLRSTVRAGATISNVNNHVGGRLCCVLRLGGPGRQAVNRES